MTAILGISAFYHDSAAALVIDGRVVAAAQEERFTRKKHDHEFPVNAIDYCLRHANLTPDHASTLRQGAAENLKRITIRTLARGDGAGAGGWFDPETTQSPWWIEPFTNFKTIWHPSAT